TFRIDPKHDRSRWFLAWLLTTCPEPKFRNPQRALAAARKAVELAPQQAPTWQGLGMAHYRLGGWKARVEGPEESRALQQNPKAGHPAQGFFLAMARWQLGQKDEARKWFDRAVRWMDQQDPRDEELRRFRAEAVELLGIKSGQ